MSGELDSLIIQCRFIALALLLLSAAATVVRVRSGRLLSAVGGVHVNMLLFFGIGLLAYLQSPPTGGLAARIAHTDRHYARLLDAIAGAGWPLVAGYAMAVAADVRANWHLDRSGNRRLVLGEVRMWVVALLAVLAIVGYIGSLYDFSTSGVGTIFPVFKLMLYPAVALAIVIADSRRVLSWVLVTIILGFAGYVALFSPWRSELIFLAGSVGLGILVRNRRRVGVAAGCMALALLVFLPFAHLKKLHFEQVTRDPVGQFVETLDMSLADRVAFLSSFWAVRVNGARELGFLIDAERAGRIETQNGETYWEALQQLVPRIVWPEKPQFNKVTGYKLARDVGLVSRFDHQTSWAINIYGEVVWNFGEWALLWFAPLLYLFAVALERLSARVVAEPTVSWVLGAALFFQFLTGAVLVWLVTYLLWLFLLAALLDYLLLVPDAPPLPAPT